MKVRFLKQIEFDVETLRASMQPRYWEGATVNGVEESDDDPKIPLRKGDMWILSIDLESGHIDGWPAGVTAKVHYKVCDAGVYTLLDPDGEVIITKQGYVPSMLAPPGDGSGDYVILDIDEDGMIQGWKADLAYFEDDDD